MEDIVLIGGGGHARACVDVIESMGKYKIVGFIDQNDKAKVFNYPNLGDESILPKIYKECKNAFIAVGQIKNCEARKRIYASLKVLNFTLPTIISPLAYVAKTASIDEGSIIMHHALVNSNSKVGKCAILNTKSLIEHDCVVGDFCHISTGAILNGTVIAKDETFVGSGAVVVNNIEISGFNKAYSLIK